MDKAPSMNRFKCTHFDCGRLFKTKFSMKRHMILHKNEKKFICENCGKKFALLQYLKDHSQIHNEKFHYICGVNGCQERFKQSGKLSNHRRTHKEYCIKHYDCQGGLVVNSHVNFERVDSPNKKSKPELTKETSFKNVKNKLNSKCHENYMIFHINNNLKNSCIKAIEKYSDKIALEKNLGDSLKIEIEMKEKEEPPKEFLNMTTSFDIFLSYLKNITCTFISDIKIVLPRPCLGQASFLN